MTTGPSNNNSDLGSTIGNSESRAIDDKTLTSDSSSISGTIDTGTSNSSSILTIKTHPHTTKDGNYP
jgi:hypothetical protein